MTHNNLISCQWVELQIQSAKKRKICKGQFMNVLKELQTCLLLFRGTGCRSLCG